MNRREKTMQPNTEQQAEIDKYVSAYQHPDYRMGEGRMSKAYQLVQMLPHRGSLLDVGTGRGEFLQMAGALGYGPVLGTEVVPDLLREGEVVFALATALPWQSGVWDVVTCFDVLEHLTPDDTIPALEELGRTASSALVLGIADYPHVYRGVELHVNRRQYDEWDKLIREYVPHRAVTRFPGLPEMWLVRR